MLVYCFILFGTYASDRVIATNRAPSPAMWGNNHKGCAGSGWGCRCRSRAVVGIAPIPVAPSLRSPPRGRGKEQIGDQGDKLH